MKSGAIALATAATVLTAGCAAPLLVTVVALTTAVAGTATIGFGMAEVGEAFTGHNVIRDDLMGGNESLYNMVRDGNAFVAETGTTILSF